MKAALCKASPFTIKPARVGKPSPRRSPEQIPSSQREGGVVNPSPLFLCSTLFAFFMRTVSHTLARQHRCCAALFYSGDSLRFPAYNGNVMPSWYTIIFFVYGRVVYKPRCLLLFFYVGTFVPVCARVHGVFWRECPGTPRVKPHEKSRLFSDRGAKSFLWSAFLSGNPFFCARFCGVARAWKEPLPSVVFHPVPGRKSGFPGLCQPVAHTCKPMPNPVIFRPKLSGFPGVAATTRGFSAGRTWRNFSPPCGAN